MLEELGQPYEAIPVDTAKGEQHAPAFRAINPNGKVPAIVDTEGPGGREARVFDSSAILLYLGEKTGPLHRYSRRSAGPPCHGCSSSPPGSVRSRVRRCISSTRRRKSSLTPSTGIGAKSNGTIASWTSIWLAASFIVGADYSIADMSAWGWLTRASDRAARRGRSARRTSPTQAPVRDGRRPPGGGAGESGREGSSASRERSTRRRSARCSRRTIRKSRCDLVRARLSRQDRCPDRRRTRSDPPICAPPPAARPVRTVQTMIGAPVNSFTRNGILCGRSSTFKDRKSGRARS